MSLKTWKKEFYPTPASRCSKRNALSHSLLKWLGLDPEVLKRHGLKKYSAAPVIVECDNIATKFFIDDRTCALCLHFLNTFIKCKNCPIRLMRGQPCDIGFKAPYVMWLLTGDPNPMIRLLRRAIKRQEAVKEKSK